MSNLSRINRINDFYELEAGQDIRSSPLFNDDLAPTKITERTWTTRNVAALWAGMAICVPTYTLGGVLTTFFGLSVLESLFTILLANIIILIPLCLNAFPGTRYGIPFPVLVRSSFGTIGSNLPCLIRAIVACGWFGIHTLFGGIAVHLLISAFSSTWANLGGSGEVAGFFIFLALNLWVVIRGEDSIKFLAALAAPLLLIISVGLMIWALPMIDIVELMESPANRPEGASFWSYFFGALTAMVGFWATLSLNISDFSRYACSQKDQVRGQIIGLPLTMFFFATLGVIMTAASPELTGEVISDPIHLIGKINSPYWVALSMVMIIIATFSTNAAANIVSPANDFQNIAPQYINRTRGAVLTGVIGILLMSFELFIKMKWLTSDLSIEDLYTGWLLSYSSLLGPIGGIMVVDYFIIRHQKLNLVDLYQLSGVYPRVNYAGMLAFLVSASLTVFSLISGKLDWFYHYGWFTGSLTGGALYALFARRLSP